MSSLFKAFPPFMWFVSIGCNEHIPHPMDVVKRVGTLSTTVVRLENECRSAKGRFCGLDELPFSEMSKWGDIRLESPTHAIFEEFDLQLLLAKDRFCLAAFPARLPNSFVALWKDDQGKRYVTRYPWREVPKACEIPNRPRLLVE